MLGWSGAMWMENIARNWLVWKLTESPLELGLTNLVRSLPQVFLALPAGVMADRFNKKWVLLISQTVTFVSYLVIFTLVITDTVVMWHVYVPGRDHGRLHGLQTSPPGTPSSPVWSRPRPS